MRITFDIGNPQFFPQFIFFFSCDYLSESKLFKYETTQFRNRNIPIFLSHTHSLFLSFLSSFFIHTFDSFSCLSLLTFRNANNLNNIKVNRYNL